MKKILCAVIFSTLAAGGVKAGGLEQLAAAAGEPGGLPVVAEVPESRSLTQGDLAALLKDPDPEVRKAAVRAAKPHILNGYAHDPVIAMLGNAAEREDVRVEAARVLSHAGEHGDAQEALRRAAVDPSAPSAVRVMAYKALWSAADFSNRWQDFLIEAVRRGEPDPACRRAAIWALWATADSPRSGDALLDAAAGPDPAARVEALKSLYSAVNRYEVERFFRATALNAGEAMPARLAAVYALSASSQARNFLRELAAGAQETEIRKAAVAALSPDQAWLREYFHLGYRTQNGAFVSPIERE